MALARCKNALTLIASRKACVPTIQTLSALKPCKRSAKALSRLRHAELTLRLIGYAHLSHQPDERVFFMRVKICRAPLTIRATII